MKAEFLGKQMHILQVIETAKKEKLFKRDI